MIYQLTDEAFVLYNRMNLKERDFEWFFNNYWLLNIKGFYPIDQKSKLTYDGQYYAIIITSSDPHLVNCVVERFDVYPNLNFPVKWNPNATKVVEMRLV